MRKSKTNSLLLLAAGIILPALAARAARSVAGAGYHAITGGEIPKNPANPEISWKEALIWTAFSGAIGGVARMVVRRWQASAEIPAEGYDLDEDLEEVT